VTFDFEERRSSLFCLDGFILLFVTGLLLFDLLIIVVAGLAELAVLAIGALRFVSEIGD